MRDPGATPKSLMRDRRSRALAFFEPTPEHRWQKLPINTSWPNVSASAMATPLLTKSNVLRRQQLSRDTRFKSIGGRSVFSQILSSLLNRMKKRRFGVGKAPGPSSGLIRKAPWQSASTTNLFWVRIAEGYSHCYGDKTMLVITGRRTNDLDIASFAENYTARAFQGIRTTLMTTRDRTVGNFVIRSDAVDTLRLLRGNRPI